MKKAAIGAALLGLLFLGAAAWSQDPVGGGDPPLRQAEPPTFRDVLRGKVGQQCDVVLVDGVWTLSFPAGAEVGADREQPFEIPFYRRPGTTIEDLDQARERKEEGPSTLSTVGQDFVQLREPDGTEWFILLSRVDVVVRAAGK